MVIVCTLRRDDGKMVRWKDGNMETWRTVGWEMIRRKANPEPPESLPRLPTGLPPFDWPQLFLNWPQKEGSFSA